MIPAAFEYTAPSSLEDALELLVQNGDEAKLLAGGHSLLPLMKLRLAMPGLLVDLGRLDGLRSIQDGDGYLRVGAMATHYAAESSDLVRRRAPLLTETAGMVGDMQVRNRGTVGGSAAHADPAGDLPAVMVALDATVVARGPSGERLIPASNFFTDIWTTALEPEEIVTEIRFPHYDGQAQHYEKFRQRAADWAIVGVAVNITRTDGTVKDARVVLTNVGSRPTRATGVEEALKGAEVSAETIRAAAEHAAEGLEPPGELKASPDYKRHLAQVLTRRALESALQPS